MNKLSSARRVQIVAAFVEGMSTRSTCRMTGAVRNTVTKLLRDLGAACRAYQDRALRDLPCQHVQVDEIWSFCYAKEKNVPEGKLGTFGYGDIWTWTALCADTKLLASFCIGERDAGTAYVFVHDLAERLRNRVQLTTDGHKAYLETVDDSFNADVDYAMLVKLYGAVPPRDETRYIPPKCNGPRREAISGDPHPAHVSTDYVGRQNPAMRMRMRRFTHLSPTFSKKVENLEHAVALHSLHYNFARIHPTLRLTPAMEAGVADHLWSLKEVVGLLDSN